MPVMRGWESQTPLRGPQGSALGIPSTQGQGGCRELQKPDAILLDGEQTEGKGLAKGKRGKEGKLPRKIAVNFQPWQHIQAWSGFGWKGP